MKKGFQMARPYTEDFRKKALDLVKGGMHIDEVARLLNIGRSNVFLWKKKLEETGSCAPEKKWQRGYGNKILDLEKFKSFALGHKHLSAVEMAKIWGNITPKTIRKYLHKIGFTVKKSPLATRKETNKNVWSTWRLSNR